MKITNNNNILLYKNGHRMRTEQVRHLEHLPLFIHCEIEYELNHYDMLNRNMKIIFRIYDYF
jgi:hypothetical protein